MSTVEEWVLNPQSAICTDTSEKHVIEHAIAAGAIERIESLISNTTDSGAREDISAVIEGVLVVIQDQFYLIPKVTIVDGEPGIREAPPEAITEPLYELWNTVSN